MRWILVIAILVILVSQISGYFLLTSRASEIVPGATAS